MAEQNTVEDINFHDCKVYSLGFNSEENQFLIDIDFIVEWIEKHGYYLFQVVPSTLVFENVWDLNIDISMDAELIIDNIKRLNPTTPRNIKYLSPATKEYDWTIELLQGEINFKSIGFRIYKRKEVRKQKSQSIKMEERGGFSLEEQGEIISVT